MAHVKLVSTPIDKWLGKCVTFGADIGKYDYFGFVTDVREEYSGEYLGWITKATITWNDTGCYEMSSADPHDRDIVILEEI